MTNYMKFSVYIRIAKKFSYTKDFVQNRKLKVVPINQWHFRIRGKPVTIKTALAHCPQAGKYQSRYSAESQVFQDHSATTSVLGQAT